MSWHIDTWAPTEGIVFASERAKGIDLWSTGRNPEPPTFLISAPGFDAHPVDRSIAFGALRRGFQERFSVNGRSDFSFDSLNQIVLFSRRIYAGSGPGTSNSGDGESPDPGPTPERGGRDSMSLARGRLRAAALRELPNGKALLAHLNELKGVQAHDVLKHFLTEEVCWAASDLLRHCFNTRSGSELNQDNLALLGAALQLASFDQRVELVNDVTRSHLDPEMRYLLRKWEQRGLGYLSSFLPTQRSTSEVPKPLLSRKITADFKFPASVRTSLDALQFVCADRMYVASLPPQRLWPLLLALAAIYQVPALGVQGSLGWFRRSLKSDLLDHCAKFLARSLPITPLPDSLEKEIKKWSRLGPKQQRNRTSET